VKADNDIVAVASDSFIDAMSILNCSSPGRCATPTNEDVVIQDDEDERMSINVSMSSPGSAVSAPIAPSASFASAPSTAGIMQPPSPVSRDQLQKRIESLQQQNRVLKCELETYKLRVKSLQEENKAIRQASVHIQAKAEQEEEFISNTLLKKIQALKKEKESLALNYEQEEECLTNDLSRKLNQLRAEKIQLEHTLEQEQECLVNKLMRRIEKLESETNTKQSNLETLRREKVELENTLEQEQEALVNKLWKRMDKLETEKRSLQVKLDQPVSEPPSPRALSDVLAQSNGGDTAANLANNIHALRQEVARLKKQLEAGKAEHERKMAAYAKEEQEIREENLRLQRRLQLEMERREALCRHLSESESSLEMEEERAYNELGFHHLPPSAAAAAAAATGAHVPVVPCAPGVGVVTNAPILHRTRTLSSPVPPSVAGIHVVAPPPPLPPPSAISTPRIPVATVGSAAAIRPPQMTPPSTSHAPNQQKMNVTPPNAAKR